MTKLSSAREGLRNIDLLMPRSRTTRCRLDRDGDNVDNRINTREPTRVPRCRMKVSSARIRERHPFKPAGLIALSGFAHQRTIRFAITMTAIFSLFERSLRAKSDGSCEDGTDAIIIAFSTRRKRGNSRLSLPLARVYEAFTARASAMASDASANSSR